jgi:hypothetical protein
MDHNLGMKDYAVLVDRIHKRNNHIPHRIQDMDIPSQSFNRIYRDAVDS